jgi:hypothetical protein
MDGWGDGKGGFGSLFLWVGGVLRGVRAVWFGRFKILVRDCFSETTWQRVCHGTWDEESQDV